MKNMHNDYSLEEFLTKEQQDAVLSLTTSKDFPWYYTEGTILYSDQSNNPYIIEKGINPFQFCHYVDIQNCYYLDVIRPILNTLAIEAQSNIEILKIKFNMLFRSNNNQHHLPHTDIDQKSGDCFTALYYVNDSDGDTYLFNEFGPNTSEDITIKSKLTPKKGKMLIFDSARFHCSSSPINTDFRIVLNIVFKINRGISNNE